MENPKRFKTEDWIGRVFNNHAVVSLNRARVFANKSRRCWNVQCLGCGVISVCWHDWLSRKSCSNADCRAIVRPPRKEDIQEAQETIPDATPCILDPRWKELALPVFQRLPIEVQGIESYGMRHALAWMEENEWATFDVDLGLWIEHPEHLTKRLIEAAKNHEQARF
jgi:hypothetical protein